MEQPVLQVEQSDMAVAVVEQLDMAEMHSNLCLLTTVEAAVMEKPALQVEQSDMSVALVEQLDAPAGAVLEQLGRIIGELQWKQQPAAKEQQAKSRASRARHRQQD